MPLVAAALVFRAIFHNRIPSALAQHSTREIGMICEEDGSHVKQSVQMTKRVRELRFFEL